VELEPEVRDWLEALPTALFARAAFYIDLLAEQGPQLGEPHTKQLVGRLRELRFYLDRDSIRVTYWIATDRRIVLLTVFRKDRQSGTPRGRASPAGAGTMPRRSPHRRRTGVRDGRPYRLEVVARQAHG
jgi:phage-related protein